MAGDELGEIDDDRGKAPVRALAYEAAQRRLSAQREDREQIRNRSGAQLTVAVAAASVLMAAAFNRGDVSGGNWRFIVGLAALAGVAACHAFVFWPREWWFFSDARRILTDYSEGGYSLSQSQHYLAEYDTDHAAENETFLGRMSTAVAISAIATVIEVAFLTWFLVSLG